jgi:hypothetical protein
MVTSWIVRVSVTASLLFSLLFVGAGGARAEQVNAPVVGVASMPDGGGYWMVASDGAVFSFGDASFYGSVPGAIGHRPASPVVGMAATPDGRGYWLAGSDGGLYSFGDASFHGSVPGAIGHAPASPVVGMAATPDGRGYWLAGSDGGLYSLGDASFYGSVPGAIGHRPASPVVGMAATPDGHGYWLAGSDGGLYSFGDASFYGSVPGAIGHAPASPVVGIASTPDGRGYWLVGSDGGLYSFGDAAYHGSVPAIAPSGLKYGPGPQSTYTVQPQPPAGSCHYSYQGSYPLPDPHCTPGSLNPQVTQSTIGSTICRSGYTSSIRPPESVTDKEKQGSASAYSYTGSFSTGEYDHLVPLELGGDPNEAANLWVEPNDRPNATSTANSKDVLENRLNSRVCSGQMSLAAAQQAIASNWVSAYQTYG